MAIHINIMTHAAVEKVVYYWMELLAQEKYEQAFNLTYHDPRNQWTPAMMESVINGYGMLYEPGEEVFKVTPYNEAAFHPGDVNRDQDLTLFEKPQIKAHLPNMKILGYLWYGLPLNGKWSDLTATFNLLQGEGFWALELDEIHVF